VFELNSHNTQFAPCAIRRGRPPCLPARCGCEERERTGALPYGYTKFAEYCPGIAVGSCKSEVEYRIGAVGNRNLALSNAILPVECRKIAIRSIDLEVWNLNLALRSLILALFSHNIALMSIKLALQSLIFALFSHNIASMSIILALRNDFGNSDETEDCYFSTNYHSFDEFNIKIVGKEKHVNM